MTWSVCHLSQVYLQARLVCSQAKLLRPVLQVGVFTLAFLTCLSRISDYKHHWSDVLGGSLLGILVCFVLVSFALSSSAVSFRILLGLHLLSHCAYCLVFICCLIVHNAWSASVASLRALACPRVLICCLIASTGMSSCLHVLPHCKHWRVLVSSSVASLQALACPHVLVSCFIVGSSMSLSAASL